MKNLEKLEETLKQNAHNGTASMEFSCEERD